MAAAAIPYIFAAVAAVGSYSQSKQAEKAANYQANVQKVNAGNILAQAAANEDTQRRRSASQLGQQRAALAENGVALDSGTGADLTHSSALNAEMDALNIRYQGTLNSNNSLAQSKLDSMQADAYGRSSVFGAATSALSAYGASGGSFGGAGGGVSSSGSTTRFASHA